MEQTLRTHLSDAVNELNKLLRQTTDPDLERRLRRMRRVYFALWEEVIRQEIDSNTHEFREAVDALERATGEIRQARQDLQRTADAINRAVLAAKAVDAVVGLGVDLLA